MILSFSGLWEQLQAAGLPGVIVALAILAFVYAGSATDIFKTGNVRRLAAVVASLLFSGVEPGELQSAIVAAFGLVLSTLAHLVVEAVKVELAKRKK